MSEPSFVAFLERSFDALRTELPAVCAQLCHTLAHRDVAIQVGDEHTTACFAGGVTLRRGSDRAAIEVITTRRTISALIDGTSTLLDAVLSDALLLRGNPADLLTFHDGLMIYLHGAMRAPSFPSLLRDFRGGGQCAMTTDISTGVRS